MSPRVLVILLMLVFVTACEKYEDNMPYTIYEIKEGSHASKSQLKWLYQPHLSYEVIFDNTCRYENKIPSNQRDINKLFGFADCNSHHQENSARFGWRWYNDRLELLTYCYDNGVRTSQFMSALELNTPYKCHIYLFQDHYELEIEDIIKISENRANICTQGIYYLLWPYFGGDETAPQNIRIHMRSIL